MPIIASRVICEASSRPLVEFDVAQALAAWPKRGAHGISACQVDKAGSGKFS
jgi:hypothetical protein